MKLLAYDDGGMALDYKRLDEGTFEHPDRAQHSAMLYSLLQTCKLRGHNPYDWLLDVIHRLTDGDPELDACLPNRWKPKPPAHFKRAT